MLLVEHQKQTELRQRHLIAQLMNAAQCQACQISSGNLESLQILLDRRL